MANDMWLSQGSGTTSSRLETEQNCDNKLFKVAASLKSDFLLLPFL